MPGVLINWKSEQAYPRLIAALVASIDAKIDYTKIASLYGQGATYNSIEGRFRIIKKEALDLKEALSHSSTEQTPVAADATVTPTKKNGKKELMAGKKEKDKVVAGRVAKSGGKKGGSGARAGKAGGKAGVAVKAREESEEDKGMEENEDEEGSDGDLIKGEI